MQVLETIQHWQQRGFDSAWNEEYLDQAFATVSVFELLSGLNQDQLFGKQESLDMLLEVVHSSSLFAALPWSKQALEPLLSTIQGLDELKRCADCGRTHLKHSLVCPWCGNNPVVLRCCPQCNEAVNDQFAFCNHCGASLTPSTLVDPAPVPTQDPALSAQMTVDIPKPQRKCPQCMAPAIDGYSHCNICGASLKAAQKINPCPSCSAEVPEGYIVCTACGTML